MLLWIVGEVRFVSVCCLTVNKRIEEEHGPAHNRAKRGSNENSPSYYGSRVSLVAERLWENHIVPFQTCPRELTVSGCIGS